MTKLKYIFHNYLFQILIIYLVWRLGLFLVSYIGILYFPVESVPFSDFKVFHQLWTWWDGGILHDIAISGYNDPTNLNNNIRSAFFPLFPFMIRSFVYIVKDYFFAQVLVSALATYGALVYLYKIALLDYSKEIAIRSVIFALIFPFSLFFMAGYTEGLFFFLIISSYYYIRKEKYLLAGSLGLLASLTRFFGIMLLPIFLYEYFKNIKFDFKKVKKNILSLLLVPAGTVIYGLFLQYRFDDFLKFQSAEEAFGRHLNLNFFSTIHKAIDNLISIGLYKSDFILTFFELILPILFMTLSIYIFFKINRGYGLLGILFLLPTFFGSQFMSGNRLVIVIFPIYIFLAKISEKNRIFEYCLIITSTLLLAVFSIAYTHRTIFIG
jgi:Gpi18-like mannosyltransferase